MCPHRSARGDRARRTIVATATFLVIGIPTAPGPTLAQDVGATTSGAPDDLVGRLPGRLSLRAGLLFTGHETVARVDSDALGRGTTVDVERELGLERWTRDARFDAALGLERRHQLQAGYLALSRRGTRTLRTEIQWGNAVFPLDVEVESEVELRLISLTYRFAPVRTDRIDLGVGLGVFALFADAAVRAPITRVEESESAEFPLPVVGVDGVVALLPGLYGTAGLKYFALDIEGIAGSWREARAALEYFPLARLGVGAGYRLIRLKADGTGGIYTRAEGTLLFLDYEFRGPHLYVTVGI